MHNTKLVEPFSLTVEPIDTAAVTKCNCRGPCPHEVGPVLLIDEFGQWVIGRWNGIQWASEDGDVIDPIGWARLPSFSAQLRAEAA